MRMLDIRQIELVEGDRNYVKLTVGKDTFHARSTLQQAEIAMHPETILKISRSCLVNMRHIREVTRTPRGDFIIVMTGGRTVTSSEGFRDPVRSCLGKLKLGVGG
jgi:two-component system, LytTR family, response regulator